MTRFTAAAMEIPILNPEVQLHAIKSGLRPGKFQEAIAVAKPKMLEEFRDKAMGQIEIEELRETRRNERPTSRKDEDNSNRSKDHRKSFKLSPKFDSYNRFNTKREDIIRDILHNRLIKPPVKVGTYQDQKYVDKGKHCAFYQKFGHTTDECVAAKDLLERLARQGLLDKYIDSRSRRDVDTSKPKCDSERRDKGPRRDPVETPTAKGVINYISRGFAGGGMTNTARKRIYRAMMTMEGIQQNSPTPTSSAAISFSTSDFKSRAPNLDDPVVISVSMGPLIVKKVLLNLGSSADVLFYSTFKKMQLSNNSLQPSGGELAGFSGERVHIIVIRTEPVINPVRSLGHRVTGSTVGSQVEPVDSVIIK
ncbi:uncharacterized protein [Arachis hypogaea]|uniref:uncharacterized protein n=1 Tax=Arachis hypogaea TaxID=3818 RepID=UPI000DECF7F0|nr:uncharacterized protein LOC112703857 [Arachis hypogaea]